MEYIDRGGAIIARPIEIVRSELCSSTYLAARGPKQHLGAADAGTQVSHSG